MSSSLKVSLVMGSKSDLAVMKFSGLLLDELEIEYEVRVLSAHRTPDALFDYVASAPARGVQIFIAAAGLAAHLPGVLASKTHLPVLGVPLQVGALSGVDALLSMVQMPGGIPVGTFGVGKAGAKNAAVFAARMLALSDDKLAARLQSFTSNMKETLLVDDGKISLDELRKS
ncbi:MAG: 5-(carboxyamino)imidazole ribonucleotide mutase [Deltaproteobacteria bacterium]|nr:5-(carboxyamino)imidazole ribonucleotide mutase [Deltaproteobacteria bacterium]